MRLFAHDLINLSTHDLGGIIIVISCIGLGVAIAAANRRAR